MINIAKLLGVTRSTLFDSLRTAVATLVSLLIARALKFPEFYWAPISTIVILLSTIDPLQGAWQRFVGTALGAALGALFVTFVGRGAIGVRDRNFALWLAGSAPTIMECLSRRGDHVQHCGSDLTGAGVGLCLAPLSRGLARNRGGTCCGSDHPAKANNRFIAGKLIRI
jgi:hypothetical protein